MKKVVLTLATIATIFLSACEKEDSVKPIETKLTKSDKILCRGCGQWDIVDPEEDDSSETN